MRPTEPPRLKLRRARKGRHALWVIKNRECEISTGARQSERGKAEIALANYLVKNRQPTFGDGHPDQVLIGDCLAVYCEKHGPTIARPDGLALEVERLAEFFGDRLVSEVTEQLCNAYVDWRCAQTDKRATVNTGRAHQAVNCQAGAGDAFGRAQLVLPQQAPRSTGGRQASQVAERRERYLKRQEVAALLWAVLGFNRDGTRNRFRINRHLARFILIALYTGTRTTRSCTCNGWPAHRAAGSILTAVFFIADRRMLSKPTSAARRRQSRRASCRI